MSSLKSLNLMIDEFKFLYNFKPQITPMNKLTIFKNKLKKHSFKQKTSLRAKQLAEGLEAQWLCFLNCLRPKWLLIFILSGHIWESYTVEYYLRTVGSQGKFSLAMTASFTEKLYGKSLWKIYRFCYSRVEWKLDGIRNSI